MTWRRRLKRLALASGTYRGLGRVRPFPGIAVLAYHAVLPDDADRAVVPFAPLHVSARTFAEQCAMLAAHCDCLTLADACDVWAGTLPMPARGVVVTFDDGHRGLVPHALPALTAYKVPATVFVCTGPVATGEAFWFDAMARRDGEAAVEAAKALPHAAWVAMRPSDPAPVGDAVAPLDRAALACLAEHPLVTLGAHTVSHPILARASVEVQAAEVGQSVEALATWTGRRPTAFAYPNGRPAVDFDATTMAAVHAAGCTVAFTTREGFARRDEPALARSRFLMLADVDAAELAHRLMVSWPRH